MNHTISTVHWNQIYNQWVMIKTLKPLKRYLSKDWLTCTFTIRKIIIFTVVDVWCNGWSWSWHNAVSRGVVDRRQDLSSTPSGNFRHELAVHRGHHLDGRCGVVIHFRCCLLSFPWNDKISLDSHSSSENYHENVVGFFQVRCFPWWKCGEIHDTWQVEEN